MVVIHPKTRQRIVADRFCGDIVFDAKSSSTALNVDIIPVIGGWSDYTGLGGIPTKQQMFFSKGDELFGTDVWTEGARKKQLDELGNKKGLTRQRQKRIHMDIKDMQNI